ncbi:BMC domain-containing protein [Lacrimispora sphenoides]|uniref:Ethanolamine utilization protein EutS n=1 Tax=Lacrimispora sphenoides JCM 1415 TaxID=1297793 RepID=A0ABY1C435_9FIRM|nr:BMC domain-containing protein [Lacrimispora sphenoides]SET63198.1 ethanolamine utilization protein EutS [[Clostridium] sphenoides JCM 1415]SUY50166.1 microcompartments protein [Lacrimispora sphenoides]
MNVLERKIFESVPGKQVTLAHIIANPDDRIFEKLGLNEEKYHAIGILTITPPEVAIIAVDIAKKAAPIKIGFVDRFSGSVFILGDVAAVQSAIEQVVIYLSEFMQFSVPKITRT